jgi:hypothetical protein
LRRHGKRDGNHQALREQLRGVGISVLDLGSLGNGCPDLLAGNARGNILLEVKDPTQPPSARKLTEAEATFFATWRGPRAVVECLADAVEAMRVWGMWDADRPAPVVHVVRDARAGQAPIASSPRESGTTDR